MMVSATSRIDGAMVAAGSTRWSLQDLSESVAARQRRASVVASFVCSGFNLIALGGDSLADQPCSEPSAARVGSPNRGVLSIPC